MAMEVVALVRAAGPRTRARRFGAEGRARIVKYARERRAAGWTLEAVARELDVPVASLSRWCARPGAFVPVEVVAPEARLVVRGPGGLVVEGLTVEQVAELLRRLA